MVIEKVLNIICLIIWMLNLIFGIHSMMIGEPVNEIVYICAVLICILYYIKELFQKRSFKEGNFENFTIL